MSNEDRAYGESWMRGMIVATSMAVPFWGAVTGGGWLLMRVLGH
jgi:hypothetical protein